MAIPSLDSFAKIVAAIAAIVGIVKIFIELRDSRKLRVQELRWKKAQAAKGLNDQMLADPGALAAMLMLDWDGREFEVKTDQREEISTPVMLRSLRTTETDFSDTEAFVRDSFDVLFYYLGLFEHYIRCGLVDDQDLRHPIEYYVAILGAKRKSFETYLDGYGFTRAKSFLERFDDWNRGGVSVLSGRRERTAILGPQVSSPPPSLDD